MIVDRHKRHLSSSGLWWFAATLSSVLIAFWFSTGSTHALSNQFPDPADFSQGANVRALVAEPDYVSYFLRAETSSVRIYVPGGYGGNLTLTIDGAGHCGGTGDAGSVPTEFMLGRLGSDEESLLGNFIQNSPCSGGNLTFNYNMAAVNPVVAGAGPNALHIGYKVLEFTASRTSGIGWNTFRLTTNVGVISYFDLNPYDRFALKSNPGTGDGNFNLRFAPDCNITNTTTRNLSYFDADAGQSNQNFDDPVSTTLIRGGAGASLPIYLNDPTPGPNPVEQQVGPGGNGVGGVWRANIQPSTLHTWRWNAISSSNGIQFNLPFDGFNYNYTCPVTTFADRSVCAQNATLSVLPGQLVYPTIGFSNPTGSNPSSTTWTAGYAVYRVDPLPGGAAAPGGAGNPVPINSRPPPIAPGSPATFMTFGVRGYNPGTVYTFRYRVANASGTQFGAICTITLNVSAGAAICGIDRPSGINVNLGDPFPFNVQAYNGSGADWSGHTSGVTVPRQWATYLTMTGPAGGSPNPYVGGPYGAYIQKYEAHLGLHDGTQGTLGTGQTSNASTIFGDTSTPGPKVYNFYLVRLAGPAPGYVHLAPRDLDGQPHCQISYNVIGQPVGSLSAGCDRIDFFVGWQNGVPGPALNTIVRINDTYDWNAFFLGNGQLDFNTPQFAGIPLDLPNYNVKLWVFNPYSGAWLLLGETNFGDCLGGFSCSTNGAIGDFEPGETKTGVTYIATFNWYNRTRRAETVSISTSINPAGGIAINTFPAVINVNQTGNVSRTVPVNAPNTVTASNSSATITSTATYRGGLKIPCSISVIPATRPHVKVYGGDIFAGGTFNGYAPPPGAGVTACGATTTGGIRAFARVVAGTDRRGSSAEYGVLSINAIEGTFAGPAGFFSADLHPRVADYTSFANTTPNWGGGLGGSHCIYNYWYETSGGQDPSTNSTSIGNYLSTAALGGMDGRYYFNGGPTNQVLRIEGDATIQPNQQITIYAEGDVYIDNHINYAQVGDYKDQDRIPYFTVIARGNIYLDNRVNTLAGLYVAQPSRPGGPANKGRFITCASYTGAPQVPSDFTVTCENKLVINGAVVAQRLKLWRVGEAINTLTQIPNNESSSLYGGTNRAMEEINFIPDIVLGRPAFLSNEEPIQAIFNAPPVF